MKDGVVIDEAKRSAIRLVRQYLRECPLQYYNDEKDTFYRFVIEFCIKDIRDSDEPPLNVLYDSIRRYDEWAHKKGTTSNRYQIASRAIDDLIQYILEDV